MPNDEPRSGAEGAEEVFAGFLAARARDPAADFEALCARHPDHAERLRELLSEWERALGLLDRLGATRSLSERIESVFGDVDPGVSLDPGESSPTAASKTSERLEHLALASAPERYAPRGEIGRGGMGAVYRVWDEDLRRSVAMKMVLGKKEMLGATEPAQIEPHQLARFLEEAQITSQLEHPGIVPVHELGLDAHGRVYFTMRLVRGISFRQVIEYVHQPELAREDGVSDEWTLPRALRVLTSVCEAMAYAHAKGVVHRDLKPANVMVGRFGETYVMDWGLARVKGQRDLKDLRLRETGSTGSQSDVRTDRLDEESQPGTEAPIVTMDGDVVGTPTYMSPEQARGRIDEVDALSDVYGAGAMLYHLLTGRRPFVAPGERPSPYRVLEAVRTGPPEPVERLAPSVAPELAAICARAMARRRDERYPDMAALADDLRRFLEVRVVRAYETGAVAELRKWVRRNRPLATALAGGTAIALLGLGAVGLVEARGRRRAEEERARAETARGEAETAERRTRAVLDELEGYTRAQDLRALLEGDSRELWPPWPDRAAACRDWLERARTLEAELPRYDSELAAVRARALPQSAADRAREERRREPQRAELERARAELEAAERLVASRPDPLSTWVATRDRARASVTELEATVAQRTTWRFAEDRDRLRHDLLSALTAELIDLPAEIGSVERRLELAETLEERTVSGPDARSVWAAARADVSSLPLYRGLELEPRLGLRPLRRDPRSGLWEFLWVLSGDEPAVGADGRWALAEEDGIVLVLLPGGTFRQGCDRSGAAGEPNVDPDCQPSMFEDPAHDVQLDPFYASKYEVTQAQWLRVMGTNPATFRPENEDSSYPATYSRLHPVETVSWHAARELCDRLGLALPTEARWEYACRAGTTTVWETGNDAHSLVGSANVADLALARVHPTWLADPFDDGWLNTAPVGSLAPNAFGLCDAHGNVHEWVLEFSYERTLEHQAGDGLRLPNASTAYRLFKGGSWHDEAVYARSAFHAAYAPDTVLDSVGLRPVLDFRPGHD